MGLGQSVDAAITVALDRADLVDPVDPTATNAVRRDLADVVHAAAGAARTAVRHQGEPINHNQQQGDHPGGPGALLPSRVNPLFSPDGFLTVKIKIDKRYDLI